MKTRLKIYKMATSILLKFLTLKWDISRTIWRIKVNDGSFFGIFHALSFELNFFRPKFPFDAQFYLSSHFPSRALAPPLGGKVSYLKVILFHALVTLRSSYSGSLLLTLFHMGGGGGGGRFYPPSDCLLYNFR